MKVIFLDVDGVLNTLFTEEKTPDGFRGIELSFVQKLFRIVESTDARIVLSSDWKIEWTNHTPDSVYLNECLGKFGLKIIDRTYEDNAFQRGVGIRKYLSEYKVESYVILDDNWFDFDGELLDNFILTDESVGLTDEDVDKAILILNGLYHSFHIVSSV